MTKLTIELENLNLSTAEIGLVQDELRKVALSKIVEFPTIESQELRIKLGKLGNPDFVGMIVLGP